MLKLFPGEFNKSFLSQELSYEFMTGNDKLDFDVMGGRKWTEVEVVFRIQKTFSLLFREFCVNDWWQFKFKYSHVHGSWPDVKKMMRGLKNFWKSIISIQPEAVLSAFVCINLVHSSHKIDPFNCPYLLFISHNYLNILCIKQFIVARCETNTEWLMLIWFHWM